MVGRDVAETDTLDEAVTDTSPSGRRVMKASTIIGIGGLLAVGGTLFLWWAGTWADKTSPEVGRTVFGNVPSSVVALFYVGVAGFTGVMFYLFAQRTQNWERGTWERRSGLARQRIHALREGLTMRTLMRDRAAGLMHWAIYVGFIVLFLGTVTLEIDNLLPANLKFLEGQVYQGYSFVLDLFGLVFIAGLALGGVAPVRCNDLGGFAPRRDPKMP